MTLREAKLMLALEQNKYGLTVTEEAKTRKRPDEESREGPCHERDSP